MSEVRTYQSMRGPCLEAGVFTQRLTDRLAKGVPDVLWLHGETRRSGMLELKYLDSWVKPRKIGMRPGQAPWLWQWYRCGGYGGILVRVGQSSQARWMFLRPAHEVRWIMEVEGALDPESPRVVQMGGPSLNVPELLRWMTL